MARTRKDIEEENEALEEVEEVKAKKVRRIVEDDDDEEYEDITTDERIINIEKKTSQIFVISLISLFVSIIALLLLLINGSGGLTKNENTTSGSTSSAESGASGYDTSAFKEIKATDIASESKGQTIVVMVGRQSCGYCAMFAPVLTQVAEEYGIQARYIDFEKIVNISTSEVLDADSINVINDLKGDGDWDGFAANYFGRTPQTMFIKDNRVIYGISGYTEAADTRTAFEAAGIKKK